MGWFFKDQQKRVLLDTMGGGENKYSLYSAVVKEMLRKKKIRTKQARAMSGSNLFSFCARVHTVFSLLHVELSFCLSAVLWPVWGWLLSLLLKKHTCHTADVHCGRSKHPSPVFISDSSVHVQQQQQRGGRGCSRIWTVEDLTKQPDRLRKGWFEEFSPALLHNPTEYPDIIL